MEGERKKERSKQEALSLSLSLSPSCTFSFSLSIPLFPCFHSFQPLSLSLSMYLLRMSNSIQLATSPPLKPMPLKEERESQQEEEEKSSSSSSSSASSLLSEMVVSEEPLQAESGCPVGDAGDGYHTPTSPNHRIQAAVECPPAPKKPPVPRRYKKRKACCLVEIKDIQLFLSSVTDDQGKRSNKARC